MACRYFYSYHREYLFFRYSISVLTSLSNKFQAYPMNQALSGASYLIRLLYV